MLAVIDYGAGNLRSVMHALTSLGVENVCVARTPGELKGAVKLILPGVGAFGAGMQQLRAQDLVSPIRDAVEAGIPTLGICVGMQFLFEGSTEMGVHEGLGLLKGHVTRFPDQPGLKVPHMGWNQLHAERESPLIAGIRSASYAYFVHSYYCAPADPADVLLSTDYGFPFAAAVQRDNLYGVQFHPEKSQQTGLRLLSNFVEMPA
ncbi:MAG TPA: imidazole glycerol phosphate synthase subunit HisH [Candidatus Limnocylindrales bacterium]|nr:imidazole glycerol phosphate synthase subunit HisH [Candidatus Limnocylindrales bacterium]